VLLPGSRTNIDLPCTVVVRELVVWSSRQLSPQLQSLVLSAKWNAAVARY